MAEIGPAKYDELAAAEERCIDFVSAPAAAAAAGPLVAVPRC